MLSPAAWERPPLAVHDRVDVICNLKIPQFGEQQIQIGVAVAARNFNHKLRPDIEHERREVIIRVAKGHV